MDISKIQLENAVYNVGGGHIALKGEHYGNRDYHTKGRGKDFYNKQCKLAFLWV